MRAPRLRTVFAVFDREKGAVYWATEAEAIFETAASQGEPIWVRTSIEHPDGARRVKSGSYKVPRGEGAIWLANVARMVERDLAEAANA